VTGAVFALFALAAVVAAVDWWSVGSDRRRVEYAAKPGVLVLLTGAALVLTPADPAIRVAFVIALLFGLTGDVLLMVDRFIPGAAAFLLGHVAYIVGFLMAVLHASWLAVGATLFLGLVLTVGRTIISAARSRSATLGIVVVAYLAALGAVLILGMGTAVPAAMAGVVLFSASDALLSYGRFVGPAPGGRVLVHVTYHLAQALLVGSLVALQ
jgi:uncharacterized membrane protein YhhN